MFGFSVPSSTMKVFRYICRCSVQPVPRKLYSFITCPPGTPPPHGDHSCSWGQAVWPHWSWPPPGGSPPPGAGGQGTPRGTWLDTCFCVHFREAVLRRNKLQFWQCPKRGEGGVHHQEDIGLIYVVVIWIQNLNVCKGPKRPTFGQMFSGGFEIKKLAPCWLFKVWCSFTSTCPCLFPSEYPSALIINASQGQYNFLIIFWIYFFNVLSIYHVCHATCKVPNKLIGPWSNHDPRLIFTGFCNNVLKVWTG